MGRKSVFSTVVTVFALSVCAFGTTNVEAAPAKDRLVDVTYSTVEDALRRTGALERKDEAFDKVFMNFYKKYVGQEPDDVHESERNTASGNDEGRYLISGPAGVPDPRPFDSPAPINVQTDTKLDPEREVLPRKTVVKQEDRFDPNKDSATKNKSEERAPVAGIESGKSYTGIADRSNTRRKAVDGPKIPVVVRLKPGEKPGDLPPGFVYDPEQIADLQKRLEQSERELRYWREIDRKGNLLTGKNNGSPVSIKGDTFYSMMKLYDFDGFSICVLYDEANHPKAFSFALAPDGYEPWDQMTFFFPARAIRPMIDMLHRAQERYRDLKLGERLGSMLRRSSTGDVGLEIFKGPREGRVVLSEHCRVRGGDYDEFHKLLMAEAGVDRNVESNLQLYRKAIRDDPAFSGRFYGAGINMGNARMEMDIGKLADMARALSRFAPHGAFELRRAGIPSELDASSEVIHTHAKKQVPVKTVRKNESR